ncbi:MAG: hypothetical protein ACLFP6_03345 [Spirochaetaceae bacterium]
MKKRVQSGAGICLIVFFALLGVSQPVYAAGRQEDPIRRAEELIEDNRLNEAILIIEETIRQEPERIHEAEDLLREIRRRRGSYNELFQQLISHLIDNPQDIETTLDIIDRMESLDEAPNPRTQEQVAQARFIAQLAFDRDRVERAMNEARRALEEDRYLDAVAIYLELEEVQLDTFEARRYSDIFRNSVEEAASEAYEAVAGFREIAGTVSEASTTLLAALENRDSPREPGPFPLDPLISSLTEVSSYSTQLAEAAQSIEEQREQVRLEFPDDPVDWYLVFQDQLMRGRSEFREEEGLLPAIRGFSVQEVERSATVAEAAGRELLEEAVAEFEAGEYEQAAESFPAISPYFGLLSRLIAAREERYEAQITVAEASASFSPESLDRYLEAYLQELSAEFSSEVARVSERAQVDQGSVPTTVAGLEERKEELRAEVDAISLIEGEWGAEVAAVQAQLEELSLPPRASLAAEAVSSRISARRGAFEEGEVRVSSALLDRNAESLVSERREIEEELPRLAELVEGSEEQLEELEEGEDVTISRFPDQALEGYLELNNRNDEIIVQVTALLARFEEEREYIREADAVVDQLEELRSLLDEVDALSGTLATRIEEMETQIAEAQELREEGDELVAETRAALSALQVQTARNLWEEARDAYYDSLSVQEDEAFREEVDQIVIALGNDIQQAQNELIVAEVRELITEADDLYSQDEFGGARDALVEAEQLWGEVYVDPNTEVQRLLGLVNAALSVQEGRELTETDPLFPVLGNYLNLAQQDFRQGRALFSAGEENEGERLLNRAIDNLRNIRAVRPLNWNARILELRILQITAEDNFPQVFEARYEDAVDRLDEGDTLAVYGELEALAEINPDYPGLQQQLVDLEIELGLRENPVDQARVAESNQLLSQARNLANTGNRDQAVVAVSLLEEAVELNPDNQQAQFLMDQLRIRLGGQATVALDSADEQQYRLAETLFAQGQIARAFTIVERLLAEPQNQGYPPLIELRRRIALRLGI